MYTVQVKHTLPDRVRLKIPAVRNNEAAARRLENCANEIEGIHWVRANTTCAGVVVRFDASVHSEADIIEIFTNKVRGGQA